MYLHISAQTGDPQNMCTVPREPVRKKQSGERFSLVEVFT